MPRNAQIFNGISASKESDVLLKAASIGKNYGIASEFYQPEKLIESSKKGCLDILIRTSLVDACVVEEVAFVAELRI